MAPNISSLIRNTLYPKLENDEGVSYPPVPGMSTDLFFLDHENPEGAAGENEASKANNQRDLVKELLAGKIVTINDRGNRWKEAAELQVSAATTHLTDVTVEDRVLVRTIDNFQGEEAEIIILSLVRNRGEEVGKRCYASSIGFLETINCTNVALSRANHGMFIMGNARQFSARSGMRSTMIREVTDAHAVGREIELVCSRHGVTRSVDDADMFDLDTPYGEPPASRAPSS
ncbi:hypothetical protein Q5752_005345 [Cryptotrichosporon argae]